ncbi:MAG: glutathione peroxidase [Candidatus Saccharibacteria bacterium]|nr:glutathione peroxidase [Candidatus Saccharibacteria bacterium]
MGIYDLKVKTRAGDDFDLGALKGKVSLVVNTATGCGFTPQYEAIEKLYEKYHSKGFEVLDFPCDQFGHQAPGSDDEIHEFCTAKYKTKFDQFAKIEVNGENASPVFAILKEQQPKEEVKGMKNKVAMKAITKMSATCKKEGDIVWNFTKFLVNKEGNAVKRYDSTFNPSEIESDLVELL